LFSVPVQVIAWGTVSEMTCNVSSNLTHSLTHWYGLQKLAAKQIKPT